MRRAAIGELLASGGAEQRVPITVTSDPGLRFAAVDAFADLAEELALSAPLLIGVDDLQWADASSLLTLGVLSRRVEYARQALLAASILGSSFTVADLSVTMARPALELSSVLEEGIRAGVLAGDGGRLRFRHDLIRDAIYENQLGSIRQGLHREAGQRLAQAGAPSRQVAEQLARGAGPGDTEAITWLPGAGRGRCRDPAGCR